MALPLTVRTPGPDGDERMAETRDVSFRGLYFNSESKFEVGAEIEFVLMLPKEITLASDVKIHCTGVVVRVEPTNDHSGIAAQIDRYEFLPQS
jgi:hypothetical protein